MPTLSLLVTLRVVTMPTLSSLMTLKVVILKPESRHDANFVITGDIECCHSETIEFSRCQLCHHWWHWMLSFWNHRVFSVPTLSSLVTLKVFIHRVVSMPTLSSMVTLKVVILKPESCHDANFVITGDIEGCHSDNLQCHQQWQSWHHDDFLISVVYPKIVHTVYYVLCYVVVW